jgi:hypothetical protein
MQVPDFEQARSEQDYLQCTEIEQELTVPTSCAFDNWQRPAKRIPFSSVDVLHHSCEVKSTIGRVGRQGGCDVEIRAISVAIERHGIGTPIWMRQEQRPEAK